MGESTGCGRGTSRSRAVTRPGIKPAAPMCREFYFITHPDVVVDPAIPVPRWPLSARGRERMQRMLTRDWVRRLGAIWCSDEQKALDAAEILARDLGLAYRTLTTLGENDRSATGYLRKSEFEATADEFFARPDESVRGWERAIDAQARIVRTVEQVVAETPGRDPVGIIAHGGVGALLLCHLKHEPISRRNDQPPGAGGNYFLWRMPEQSLVHGWQTIDPTPSG